MCERCSVPLCRFAAKWEVTLEDLVQRSCGIHLPMVLTEGLKCFRNKEVTITVRPLGGIHSAA